ncbi:AAA family ATPase [Parvibaculum sp.]|uniref:AAA family ATPase n=1 Tax=Parvibaculum sp. TaxID=2024848 RepID=UPI00320F17D4
MLIILGGLPGAGKTTIARELARSLEAVHIRIDTIEHALAQSAHGHVTGEEGYRVGYALAEDNLRLGRTVIADSVNPIEITRAAWRGVAVRAGVPFAEIEVICSGAAEHRSRVESRTADIVGFKLPTWAEVEKRDYHPWESKHIVVDTAGRSAGEVVAEITSQIAKDAG